MGGADGNGVPRDETVLILTAASRDAQLTAEILAREAFPSRICRTAEELLREAEAGAGALLLAEESLPPELAHGLIDLLERQPFWSDLPVIVLTSERRISGAQILAVHANLTLLERPVRIATLTSAVGAALSARRRQLQVRDLVERLAETDRAKDDFLAMLGHELRNPLSAISAAVAVLEETGNGGPVAQRQRALIARQVSHLSRLVGDLLDVSRVTRGKINLQREPLDLVAVARAALETLEASDPGRRLKLRLPAGPVPVEGDPVRLEQVVTNLLSNAVKYTSPGGEIVLSVRRQGDRAMLSVRDDGIGIPPQLLPRIFEPFTQVSGSLARSRGGLGLGLALVHRLVTLHGGSVEATSEGEDRGSELTVRLPLRTSRAGRPETPEDEEEPSTASSQRAGPTPELGMVARGAGAER